MKRSVIVKRYLPEENIIDSSSDEEFKVVLYYKDNKSLKVYKDSDMEKYENPEEVIKISLLNCTYIPDTINRFINLKKLYCEDNQIAKLPESLFDLVNLEELHIGGNFLNEIPESIVKLKNLKILDLEYGKIQSIPDCIGELPNLESLNLNENRLTTLPESLGNCIKLKSLIISHNNITVLPITLFKLKKTLKKLEFSCNPVEDLHKMVYLIHGSSDWDYDSG